MEATTGGPEDPALDRDAGATDAAALAAGNTAFAAALFAEAAGGAENFFFSPASISVALAMTYAGARGETAAEMARALHLPPLDEARLHAAFGALAAALHETPGVELAIANALFAQEGAYFRPEFLALLADRYGAGLRRVSFADSAGAAKEINDWVEEQTRGKITDLVPPGVLDALTRLVLVNAIYFKGAWAMPFPEADTRELPFFRPNGDRSPAPLMVQKGELRLAEIDGGQILELPYAGDAVSMVVLLPHAKDGLAEMEERLAEKLDGWLDALDGVWPEEVHVYFPRFRVETSLALDAALKGLGMVLAFSDSQADFAGMNGESDDLYIAAALHKAFVEVNEEGTTAAAATAIVMATRAAAFRPPSTFRADHPFVFLIRDTRTKSVLFLGRLVDPTG